VNLADRVKETTTTTGTGSLTLAGAATGFRSFNAAIGQGPRFYYVAELPGASEWEVGVGYLSAATTLVRETVLKSSNAGSLVSFSAGTKNVFVAIAADRVVMLDETTGAARVKGELVSTPSVSAGALTLDLANANVFRVSLSASVTSLTISNPIASGSCSSFTLILDITGNYSITWPASVKWPNASAPALTTTAGKVDVLTFLTTNGGTTWLGFTAGKNY
jgi:hypothetical protein